MNDNRPVEDVRCPHCRKVFNPAVEKAKEQRNRLIAARDRNRAAMVAEQQAREAREAELTASERAAVSGIVQMVLNYPDLAAAKATVAQLAEPHLRDVILAEVERLTEVGLYSYNYDDDVDFWDGYDDDWAGEDSYPDTFLNTVSSVVMKERRQELLRRWEIKWDFDPPHRGANRVRTSSHADVRKSKRRAR